MNKETQWLFAKLAKVLGAESLAEITEEPDWNGVLTLAKQHAVLSFLDPLLEEPEEVEKLPENVKICIREEAGKTVRQNYHLLYLEHQIIQNLQEESISVILLKGASTAAFYPVPELRKSGDVDLLLPDPAQLPKAEEVMKKLGFDKNAAHSVNHHVVYRTEKHIEVELHTLLAEPFDDKETNRLMEEIQKRVVFHVEQKELMGITFPVLPDGLHAYSLLLHMLQHFLRAGFGLKLLCDWVVFWRHEVSETERKTYQTLLSQSGLTGFSDRITSICVRYLGLEENVAARILQKPGTEEDDWEFMEEILKSLEFGTTESEQMVALRGSGWKDLFREFHHQMHLNFPKAGKHPILWPVLWGWTGGRFVRNNRRIRKTTMRQVIENARKRGKIGKKLQLFKK